MQASRLWPINLKDVILYGLGPGDQTYGEQSLPFYSLLSVRAGILCVSD